MVDITSVISSDQDIMINEALQYHDDKRWSYKLINPLAINACGVLRKECRV